MLRENQEPQLYDDKSITYDAATNEHAKALVTCHLFKAFGKLEGKTVLDMACGTGYHTRQFKTNKALLVKGVDISKAMIEKAREIERVEKQGIEYEIGNAMEYYKKNVKYDIVTAQYLLPYAEDRTELWKMCEMLSSNVKDGGKLVTITHLYNENCTLEDPYLGYKHVPRVRDPKDDPEVLKVDVTLYSDDRN